MRLTIEMHDPQAVIMDELTNPVWRSTPQWSVAITYASIIAQESELADWPKINAAILKRWPKGGYKALDRIKKLAWKQLLEWEARGRQSNATPGHEICPPANRRGAGGSQVPEKCSEALKTPEMRFVSREKS